MTNADIRADIFNIFREDVSSNAIMESEEDIKIFNNLMAMLRIENYIIEKVGDIAPMWTKRCNRSPATWRKLLDNSAHRTIYIPIKENTMPCGKKVKPPKK